MKYKILCNSEFGDLTEEVNRYLKDGWYPQGGVAIHALGEDSGVVLACQAIAFDEDED
jgi:Domain of unknown function (DUF1737)